MPKFPVEPQRCHRPNCLKLGLVGLLPLGMLSRTVPMPLLPPATASPAPDSTAAVKVQIDQRYRQLPLSFELNQGQSASEVKYVAKGRGYSLFFTPTEVVLALLSGKSAPTNPSTPAHPRPTADLKTNLVRMKLLGSNRQPQIKGLQPLPGKVNYLIGNQPQQWHQNIATYGRVAYQNVYPGVNLVYYGNQQQLEYDFVVAPFSDPKQIVLSFEGVSHLEVNRQGELVLQVGTQQVKWQKPHSYQRVQGRQQEIASRYQLLGKNQVRFEVASYDPGLPLVIDPVLSYSTYLGGGYDDHGFGIAVDSDGNAYVTGYTYSTNFPTKNPLQATLGSRKSNYSAFVTKLSNTGSLSYSTYLGGSGSDYGKGIAVDGNGSAYVTGMTYSTNFPTKNPLQATLGGYTNAFVTRLDPTGTSLSYSTYLGGSGGDSGSGIAVDRSGSAYVTGYTSSTNFPTKNPLKATLGSSNGNAFVTKLNATGTSLSYSTYLGGSSSDSGSGIAVDRNGSAYVTGHTSSTNFPTKNPLQATLGSSYGNAFVTKLNGTGTSLSYSTYLGGSGGSSFHQYTSSDSGSGIAVDRNGSAYVTGRTISINFPTKNPLQATLGSYDGNAFVTKLSNTGSLSYSTYLGGSGGDSGSGIAVDRNGSAYVTGTTLSTNFPTKNPFQAARSDSTDAFVTKLRSDVVLSLP